MSEGIKPILLTRGQVAKLLNLCERTVYHLDKSGVLPALRIGRSVRYRRSDIEKFAGDDGGESGG